MSFIPLIRGRPVEFLLVSSQFLLDEGVFQTVALVHIIETTLGAEKGSFAYILEMYQKDMTGQNTRKRHDS